MNYIEQIKKFWQLHELHQFSVTEIALYFHLLEICNRCSWTNPFKRNNARISADLDVSINTLKNARNHLQQSGLITFTSKAGNANVTYQIITRSSNFDEVSAEVTNEVSCEVGTRLDTTKDKLNQTKLNNKSISSYEDNAMSKSQGSRTKPESISYKDLVSFFNHETKGVFGELRYPISEKRQIMISARIREHGKQSFIDMINAAKKSNFLKGENKRGFVATFDWMIKPNNFQKIIEGNYENINDRTTKQYTYEEFGLLVTSGKAEWKDYERKDINGEIFYVKK
ncbi:MAG: hypothetical protein LBV72_10135 [Tannerella sp.]|jgi:hypothetical protein|nr:hypothetical protein [Tannerella sp.]